MRTLKDYVELIKLQLFGGILVSELSDEAIEKIIMMSLEELNKYYNTTEYKSIPCSACIDLTAHPEVDVVVDIFRENPMVATASATSPNSAMAPDMFGYPVVNSGNAFYYPGNYVYNTIITTTMQKIAGATSTDLVFRQDKKDNKLYINFTQSVPGTITIEYIPKLLSVTQICDDFWQDTLLKLSLAHTKVILGRIRTRFKQNSSVWEGDGSTMLEEGKKQLEDIVTKLERRSDYILPID